MAVRRLRARILFTDNTSYHGREILRQQPLPGLEGHVSYFLVDNIWASIDALYSFRGGTDVNGVNQNNAQKNFALGTDVNVSLNPQNSLVFQFAKALVHQNGPAITGFAVKYSYSWGKGYIDSNRELAFLPDQMMMQRTAIP